LGSIQSCNGILVSFSIEGFAAIALSDAAAGISSSFFIWFLFAALRRPQIVDLGSERAEAGRILMTSASDSGVSGDDRTYLVQQVAATTALSPGEAERPVDAVIADSKLTINRSRHITVIVAFSLAAATLLGNRDRLGGCRRRRQAPRRWFGVDAASELARAKAKLGSIGQGSETSG